MRNLFIILLILTLTGCSTVEGPMSGKKYSSFAYDHRIFDNPEDIFSYDKYNYLSEDYANEARNYYVKQNPGINDKIKDAILDGIIVTGMKPNDVIASLGKPVEKNTTHTKNSTSEQWIYGQIDSDTTLDRYVFIHHKKFVYFDDNIVTAFQD